MRRVFRAARSRAAPRALERAGVRSVAREASAASARRDGSTSRMTRPAPVMVAPANGPTRSRRPPRFLITTSSLPTTSSTATASGRTPERTTSTGSRASARPAGRASTRSRRTSSTSSSSTTTRSRSPARAISSGRTWMTLRTACMGTAKVSPPARTRRASETMTVRGSLMVIRVPAPSSLCTSISPLSRPTLARTTSMPTPRPDVVVTSGAVLKPGRKTRLSASRASRAWASAGDSKPSRAARSRRRAGSMPRPSSVTSM